MDSGNFKEVYAALSEKAVHGPLSEGETFGRYRIMGLLGAGGMGYVYRAWDDELGEAVALKVMRVEFARSPTADARFRRELSLSRHVTHTNVLRIYDLGQVGTTKYISMPFIEGADLATLVARKELNFGRALSLTRQLCAGLASAHQAGIVHRDLKPENVLIDGSDHLYLMDFGLARSAEATHYTATGTVLGTLEYMSPEQAKGEPADHRSDIYALGIILYEMFAGERPFHGETPMSRLTERLHKPAPDPRIAHPEIPGYVGKIILRCLEREVENRYQSVDEILADLTAGRAASIPWKPRLRSSTTLKRVAAAIVAAALLAGGYTVVDRLRTNSDSGSRTSAGPVISMAILPFRNASGDSSLEWLGGSLAEMLRTDIGQSASLRTVSSDRLHQIMSDLRLTTDAALDETRLRRLADFSSATVLVWGQYTKLGNQIRIDATYENFENDRRISLKAEAAGEGDLLKAIDQLAHAIQQETASSRDVLRQLRASAFKPTSTSVQALRSFSQGLQLTRQGNNGEALKLFEAATREDPRFALAYSRLGLTYAALRQTADAERVSRTAVELSAELPPQERHLIAANHARIMNDNVKAIEAYESLVKIFSDDSDIHLALAGLYESTGGLDKAYDEFTRVLATDSKHLEALFAVARIEIQRRKPEAALEFLNRGLSLAIQLENNEARGNILNAIGIAYKRIGKPEEALRYYQEALDVRRKAEQKGGIAATLNEIAQVQDTLGNADDALRHYLEALELRREIGERRGTGQVLLNLGQFYLGRARYDEALNVLAESLQIQREVGNKNVEALCLNNIGAAYHSTGQFHNALTYFQQSLAIREKLNVPADLAQTYRNLAETTATLGEYEQALAHYLKAVELGRKADDKRGVAQASAGMADIFELQGRYAAAVDSKQEALKTFRELEERGFWMAEIVSGYGRALSQIGRWDEAAKHLDEALQLARESRSESIVAQILNFQGDLFFYRSDFKAARGRYEQALATAAKNRDQALIRTSRANLSKLAVKDGPAQSAVAPLRELIETADRSGQKDLSAASTMYLGEAFLAMKDYARARSQLERALGNAERLGMRPVLAQSHDLLGKVLSASGNNQEADRHYAEAKRLLEQIRKEAGAGGLRLPL